MKSFLVCVSLFVTSMLSAQDKVVFEEDTLTFRGYKFYKNSKFRTASGSGSDKTFQWVFVSDDKYSSVKPLYNVYANTDFSVDTIYNTHRGWSVQTHLPDRTRASDGKPLKGEKVFFVVERAVANKEVVVN